MDGIGQTFRMTLPAISMMRADPLPHVPLPSLFLFLPQAVQKSWSIVKGDMDGIGQTF